MAVEERFAGRSVRCAVVLVLALAARAALAQPYDPGLSWRTIETDHFRVHFPDGLARLARRAAAAAERAHAVLVPAFAHDPAGRTEIVLSDDSDDANGSATPLPYNTIRLFCVPPPAFSELNDERDWVEALVTHEYVHILHLDTVEGWPAIVNSVFGKILTPSGFSPPFIVEGLAVLHEGGGDGGRNANAIFDMYLRALTVEGAFPRLDEVVAQPLAWPHGSMPYLLGGRFFAFVNARSGPEAITAFSKDQGSQLWPYRFDTLAERHLGADVETLWREFEASIRGQADAQLATVRRRPVTEARWLTRRGWETLYPRWLPDGSALAYFDAGPDERAGLRRVSTTGRDLGRVTTIDGNGTLAIRSQREAIVAIGDVYREFSVYGDLYRVDLETGERYRITSGERATDPDVAPDGDTVVYAAHLPGGEMALRRIGVDGRGRETLFTRRGVQVSGPRISPDGRRIAFEYQEGGRRDIALLEDGAVSFVTDDDALDLSPAWGPDGTLYFSSERTGIYDIYAFEPEVSRDRAGGSGTVAPGDGRTMAAGRLRQVTNVEMGAFEPQVSPDGRTLAFVGYSRRGYDIAVAPIDRERWLDPEPPRARPERAPGREPPDDGSALPEHPYLGLDTAWPTFWVPTTGYDGAGMTLGVLTAGSDVLVKHVYVAQGWYGLDSRQPGYSAAYLGTWLFPRLELSSSRIIDTTPGSPALLEEQWVPLSASLTYTSTHLDSVHALSAGWRALRLRSYGGVPTISTPGVDPYRDGTASEVSFSWTYNDSFRFVNSISPEEGRVLGIVGRYASPALGGSFSYAIAQAIIAQYLRVPGTKHVVLGLRGSAGAATGTLGGRQPFELGGPPSPNLTDLVLSPLLGTTLPPDLLRGYPDGAFGGSTLLDGTVELRFPIATLERGHRMWPVQLRRLHGAVFLDSGGAFAGIGQGPLRIADNLHFASGAELSAEVVVGYYIRTDVRLGIARGLGRLVASDRSDPLAETQVYLTVGPSF